MAVLVGGGATVQPAAAEGWDALKARLDAEGIAPAFIYDGDTISDLAGGARRGAVYVGNLHLQLSLDGGPLLDAPGVTVFLEGLGIHGASPDALVGDAQALSNIAAPPAWRLYEAWLQYNSSGAKFSVLAGRYDLNSEFDRLQSASLFLNSSFGIEPAFSSSGQAGPSIFPNTALGMRVAVKPAANIVLRAAVLDGVPVDDRPAGAPGLFSSADGLLLVTELALLNRPGAPAAPEEARSLIGRAAALAPYDDKLALGGWYYTAAFDDLSETGPNGLPRRHRGSAGFYVLADKLLYRGAPDRRLSGFLQLGIGDGRVDRFGAYLGFGLAAQGFVPHRPDDQFGLAVAIGRNGSHFLAAAARAGTPNRHAETAIELTYLSQLTSWLAVQPDLQYIIHPGTDPHRRNALAFQFQFEVSL